MKSVLVICLALAVQPAPPLLGRGKASPKPAWTEAKAERNVRNGATVRLPAEERSALESELRGGLRRTGRSRPRPR